MTAPAIPLEEFDREMATTRRLLERVPGDKGSWKPHQKSFPLGHLAQLVSWMPGWIATSLNEPHIEAGAQVPYEIQQVKGGAQGPRIAAAVRDGDQAGPRGPACQCHEQMVRGRRCGAVSRR